MKLLLLKGEIQIKKNGTRSKNDLGHGKERFIHKERLKRSGLINVERRFIKMAYAIINMEKIDRGTWNHSAVFFSCLSYGIP